MSGDSYRWQSSPSFLLNLLGGVSRSYTNQTHVAIYSVSVGRKGHLSAQQRLQRGGGACSGLWRSRQPLAGWTEGGLFLVGSRVGGERVEG